MILYVATTLIRPSTQNYRDTDPTEGLASAFNCVWLEAIATIISVFTVLMCEGDDYPRL
ncbi:hypothetical protein ACIGB6_06465 [Paeniglutamicibacter gangotriensis]|uniref:hypothetical protein n=1 Tax=Paeniglutamicibacter gangotriensis TaxID=254787 RepID=UPI0037CC972A